MASKWLRKAIKTLTNGNEKFFREAKSVHFCSNDERFFDEPNWKNGKL